MLMSHSFEMTMRYNRNNLTARSASLVIWIWCTLLVSMPLSAQNGALVAPRHLEGLVAESEVVLQGTVTSAVLEPHPQLKNLMTVVVTVQVEDRLKGQPGSDYQFRETVIDAGGIPQKIGYKTGQHVLLIMMKANRYGLTSPAGLQQGRFQIETGKDGTLQATNGVGNVGLFRGLNQQIQAKGLRLTPESEALVNRTGSGPLPLDQLKNLIRSLSVAK
jgi:hypothetical protein